MSWENYIAANDREAPPEIVKAASAPPTSPPAREPKAWELDPHDLTHGWVGDSYATDIHPGTRGLDFGTLAHMARVPVISAIIGTRINQVAEFATPQSDPYSPGFRIAMRERSRSPTKADRQEIERLTGWLMRCGDARLHVRPVNFEMALRMMLRDSLVFDAACLEVVPQRGGKPAGFVVVDAATIRRARATEADRTSGRHKTAGFAQVIDHQVRATFEEGELVFGIRRPRSSIYTAGYGYPELEELMRVVTHLLHAETYNANNFTHGLHLNGLLALKSRMDRAKFNAFKREFYAMLQGVDRSKRLALLQLDPSNNEGIESVNLAQTNRDMEYSQWVSWLLRIACAIYLMDPAEIGYQYGNEGQTAALSEKGPAEKIAYSRERGLRPLLRCAQEWFNRGVIEPLNPDFRLEFVGLEKTSAEQDLDNDGKAVKTMLTVNEVRARRDYKRLKGDLAPLGDMILDPTFINTAVMLLQQKQTKASDDIAAEKTPESPADDATDDDLLDIDALWSRNPGAARALRKKV